MGLTVDSLQTQIPFYLSQPAKENLVAALRSFPNDIKYYDHTGQHAKDVIQGDGWSHLQLIEFEDSQKRSVKGIVLSNSCDISPENSRHLKTKLTFAPLINLSKYEELLHRAGLHQEQIKNKIKDIREQKITNLFYLPRDGALDAEYVALLDNIHTMPFEVFHNDSQRNKLFTLSLVGFYLFIFKLSVHFCRLHEGLTRA